MIKKLFFVYMFFFVSSCVKYDALPFTGKMLPRSCGYETGVTDDWIYINLEENKIYNGKYPESDIKEGMQKSDDNFKLKWDIAFCGYRIRTNGGTSGPGKGGAADLGPGNYDGWVSSEQVRNMDFVPDNDTDITLTYSLYDWTSMIKKEGKDINNYPWFDPNKGPASKITSANPVLCRAVSFAGPPPSYSFSNHTYAIRSACGKKYYKILIVSRYDESYKISSTSGRLCYYLDVLP